jgi:hypothetical protein
VPEPPVPDRTSTRREISFRAFEKVSSSLQHFVALCHTLTGKLSATDRTSTLREAFLHALEKISSSLQRFVALFRTLTGKLLRTSTRLFRETVAELFKLLPSVTKPRPKDFRTALPREPIVQVRVEPESVSEPLIQPEETPLRVVESTQNARQEGVSVLEEALPPLAVIVDEDQHRLATAATVEPEPPAWQQDMEQNSSPSEINAEPKLPPAAERPPALDPAVSSTLWHRLMATGDAALQRNQLFEAEQSFRDALQQAEGSNLHLGQTLTQLARLQTGLKDYSKAASLAARAVSLLQRVSSAGNSALADALEISAKIEHAQKKHPEAEDFFKRALAVLENSEFRESIRTADLLNSIALALMDRRKYAEAEPLFERSLEILATASPSPTATLQKTIRDLKLTYQILKKRDKAEALDRRFYRLKRDLNQ